MSKNVVKILKSEFLKLKNSAILYLMIGLFALEWLTIPVYLSNYQTSYTLEAMTFLPMLAYCLMLAIVSLLTMEQEEQANHCQNINSSHNRAKIWLLKLLARDLIVILPCLILWGSIGYVINDISYTFYSGSLTWLLLVFLNHFHHLLSLWAGKGLNLIISFVECLFIIFASNHAFMGNFWIPIILPVNAILIPEKKLMIKTIFILLALILMLDVIAVLTLKRNKNELNHVSYSKIETNTIEVTKVYKILVVDDDFEILKLMTNIFEMQNYAVTTYQVVNSSIDINDFMGFDLILLDVMMPNVDGMALCQEIRHRIATPIIFVSAKDSEEDIISGLKLGGDDYITKPFSIKQLVAKVEAHLKREERLKQAKKDFQEFKREFSTMTFYLQ